jgi:hypothetical protein
MFDDVTEESSLARDGVEEVVEYSSSEIGLENDELGGDGGEDGLTDPN